MLKKRVCKKLTQFRGALDDKNTSARDLIVLEKLPIESLPEGGILKALARGVMAGLTTFLVIMMIHSFAEKFANRKKAYNR